MSQLEVAAHAVDCYVDEIKGWCRCKVYIYEPMMSEEKVWKDAELNGLCTIHSQLLLNTISLNVTNLVTKQVSFKVKEIKDVDFQDETFISFSLKGFDYLVGLRLLENAEKFSQDFLQLLKERAEHSNMSLEKPTIIPKQKKRFSFLGTFKSNQNESKSSVPPPRLRISLPHSDQFKHINHVEWDAESQQLIYKEITHP